MTEFHPPSEGEGESPSSPIGPLPQRCTATSARGAPCGAWAMQGHTLCRSHRDAELGPRGAGAPPGNQNARTHGFYSRSFTPEECAGLDDLGAGFSLVSEIAAARVALLRVLAALQGVQQPESSEHLDLSLQRVARLGHLAFAGARTIARLLRDNHALNPNATEFHAFMDEALDLLSEEWGVDL